MLHFSHCEKENLVILMMRVRQSGYCNYGYNVGDFMKKIDLENWCRKEHYLYYTNSLNVEVNMTANIDVSELLTFCHTNGYKFYPTLIYCVTKVLNRIENFRMF